MQTHNPPSYSTSKIPPSRTIHHTSTTQACAACKYQRRKCAADCILAPYFPHDRQRQFLNAHRLFGVSNIVKIIRHLDPLSKDEAMRTIVFQSDVRAADPVGGCFRIIRDLEQQISLATAELEIVLHQIALCRAAASGQEEEATAAAAAPPSNIDGESMINGNERWSVAEEDISWDCMHGNVNSHAEESLSSSLFPDHERDKQILENLSVADDDDVREAEFTFDPHEILLSTQQPNDEGER